MGLWWSSTHPPTSVEKRLDLYLSENLAHDTNVVLNYDQNFKKSYACIIATISYSDGLDVSKWESIFTKSFAIDPYRLVDYRWTFWVKKMPTGPYNLETRIVNEKVPASVLAKYLLDSRCYLCATLTEVPTLTGANFGQ